MSTGAGCSFKEVAPGRWTYWLQSYPYDDENENGATYGPFDSFRRAREDLDRNHANPGGWLVHELPDGQHVHEWSPGGWVQLGVRVSINVESLGPTPDRDAVIALVKALPVDHPAFRVDPTTKVWSDTAGFSCEPCGASKS